MGILTVVCYEQGGLFEYFSASGSQAGCSLVKALYCISFLCQSTVSCGGAVSNDDPRLPASRMETGLPRALEPRRKPPNHLCAPHPCLLSSLSPPRPFGSCLFSLLPSRSYFILLSPFLNICHLPTALHVSLLSSLHPFFPPPFVPLFRSGVSCARDRKSVV